MGREKVKKTNKRTEEKEENRKQDPTHALNLLTRRAEPSLAPVRARLESEHIVMHVNPSA